MDGAVPVQLGLKKFFIYLVLSAALGLLLNSFVQNYVARLWKEQQAQLAEKNITGQTPQIVFSRNGWPVVGVQIASATHRTAFKCYGLVTEVNDIFVPVPFYKIFSKPLKFGTVDVSQMKMTIQEDPACSDVLVKEASLAASATEAVETSITPEELNAYPDWFPLLEKWFTKKEDLMNLLPVPEMRVRDITIEGATSTGKSLHAKGEASFMFDDKLKIHLKLKPITFKRKERTLMTHFQTDLLATHDKVVLEADWAYDEGHLGLKLDYAQADGKANVSFKATDLPVSVLNKWFDTSWAFQFLWFHCGLDISADKNQWGRESWKISDCEIRGPHGQIDVLSSNLQSLNKPQDISFQIQNLDLDQAIKGKEQIPLHGVFKKFGVVDGRAAINKNDFTSQLHLKNSNVIFSRRNQRKLQIIEDITLELNYARSIYSVVLSGAKIQQGEFDGFVAFDYNRRLQRSLGKVSISQLQFSPEIQKLMWDGEFSPFLLSGEVSLDSASRIDHAKMNLSVASYTSPGLSASNGQMMMEWKPEGGSITATLAQLKVNRDSGYPWMFAPLLDEGVNRDVLVVSRVHSQGVFEKSKLIVEKLIATAAHQRLQMTGELTKRNSSGQWIWGEGTKNYRWKWIYADKRLTLIPLEVEMREWLKLNDTYLQEYPFIRLESQGI